MILSFTIESTITKHHLNWNGFSWRQLEILAKNFVLNVWQGSEYVSRVINDLFPFVWDSLNKTVILLPWNVCLRHILIILNISIITIWKSVVFFCQIIIWTVISFKIKIKQFFINMYLITINFCINFYFFGQRFNRKLHMKVPCA